MNASCGKRPDWWGTGGDREGGGGLDWRGRDSGLQNDGKDRIVFFCPSCGMKREIVELTIGWRPELPSNEPSQAENLDLSALVYPDCGIRASRTGDCWEPPADGTWQRTKMDLASVRGPRSRRSSEKWSGRTDNIQYQGSLEHRGTALPVKSTLFLHTSKTSLLLTHSKAAREREENARVGREIEVGRGDWANNKRPRAGMDINRIHGIPRQV